MRILATLLVSSQFSAAALSLSSFFPPTPPPVSSLASHGEGGWAEAKAALRSTECCVISVAGLEPHLKVLQAAWAREPGDIDLRSRVRTARSTVIHDDCLAAWRALSTSAFSRPPGGEQQAACVAALEALARGFSSLADGPLDGGACQDVFLRIVCASDYRAKSPRWHTDKAPIRGYVTLSGPGTNYKRTRHADPKETVRQVEELDFIVMKGDNYQAPTTAAPSTAPWWTAFNSKGNACLHRSPIGEAGQRRVIVSLDLATGGDDREWLVNTKREWRSGFNQRKSPTPFREE